MRRHKSPEKNFKREQSKSGDKRNEISPGAIREKMMESLILAQNERWRRVLTMQVERQAAMPRAADW